MLVLVIFVAEEVLLSSMAMAAEATGRSARRNRLATEKSPYLLQHATNPVDWYPWGPEAFEKAFREDKPIFLSIGYSTCHWCHVMEEESFEDPEVARLLNEGFVAIKVDREERPDIDQIYLSVCQMMTDSCGWPLTIIMTPDKKPFYAGTYIPKDNRFGMLGMLELLPRVRQVWEKDREKALGKASEVMTALSREAAGPGKADLNADIIEQAYTAMAARFDEQHGGFGGAPKFPMPHRLFFLLRYWKRTGDVKALNMVETTLQEMRRGGIYDHIGFGFHRYATDEQWLLPHFEKMLYDQALLSIAYTEAYQATGRREYRRTAEEILSYVLRDMTDRSGGFYSAEDADSEGEEGKYYTWTFDEIMRVLGKEAALLVNASQIKGEGNFVEQLTSERKGWNIIHLRAPVKELAAELKMSEQEFEKRFESVRNKLFTTRGKRPRPHRDDKILADWNGLMIAAFAKAAAAFDEPRYLSAARKAADFIFAKMVRPDGRLLHRYRDGDAAVAGTAADYAFLSWGLIELYEASFDIAYLKKALDLNREAFRLFWDAQRGGFFFTAADAESILLRTRQIDDGPVPSANSIAMMNLLRLGRLTGDALFEERAQSTGRAFIQTVTDAPAAYAQFLSAVDFALGPTHEVVIAGRSRAQDTVTMMKILRSKFLPRAVFVHRPTDEKNPAITSLADYTSSQDAIKGKATAYVCRNRICNLPTTDAKEMLRLLGEE